MILSESSKNKLIRINLSFSSSVMERSAGFSTEGRWKGEGRRVRRDTLAELAGPDQQVLFILLRIPDTGSGGFFDPGIRNRFFSRIPDPSPTHISESLVIRFWGKKYYNFLSIG
jgi:hypothetical protein